MQSVRAFPGKRHGRMPGGNRRPTRPFALRPQTEKDSFWRDFSSRTSRPARLRPHLLSFRRGSPSGLFPSGKHNFDKGPRMKIIVIGSGYVGAGDGRMLFRSRARRLVHGHRRRQGRQGSTPAAAPSMNPRCRNCSPATPPRADSISPPPWKHASTARTRPSSPWAPPKAKTEAPISPTCATPPVPWGSS